MPTWIDQIADPSAVVPADLYIALTALNTLINALVNATGIAFTDPGSAFFSSTTANVWSALTQIGDYLASFSLTKQYSPTSPLPHWWTGLRTSIFL